MTIHDAFQSILDKLERHGQFAICGNAPVLPQPLLLEVDSVDGVLSWPTPSSQVYLLEDREFVETL
jgi:hypothetical protein